jgi:predicted CoA-binding protein
MVKFSGSFLDKELLFVGFTQKYLRFCMQVYSTLTEKGFTVYPVTNEPKEKFEITVYGSLDKAPKTPRCAYLITDIIETAVLIDPLYERGVRKILFNSRNVADQAILDKCRARGIETAIACPLMAHGGGLHRFHGFLAGVKK